jgi:hypothetical protein
VFCYRLRLFAIAHKELKINLIFFIHPTFEQMRNYIETYQKGELLRLRLEGAEEYGYEKGFKMGLEEAREEGRMKEAERKTIEIICNLFSMGIRQKEELAKVVNTSLEFVERVLNDIKSGKITSA